MDAWSLIINHSQSTNILNLPQRTTIYEAVGKIRKTTKHDVEWRIFVPVAPSMLLSTNYHTACSLPFNIIAMI
ncbi:hypothetical protein LSAT2_004568 [Lamellibrachia satsuma]|nr:hypothetical protein LSAT2_004568 [Lamellibrachia satsuma]